MNRSLLNAYAVLMKPRIVMMSLIALAMGFAIAGGGTWPVLIATLLGAGLVGAGACALNHYMERDIDALMERTRDRPLPTGRVRPNHALVFGVYLVLWGLAVVLCFVNLLTAFLLLLSAFLYVLVYTPLKRVSWLNTTVGAIPGAIPPLAGWTAATDNVGTGGVILFAILFAWQHTHFYAIAWMYRQDYERAGFRMLSAEDARGYRTAVGVLVSCALLLVVSLLPWWSGLARGLSLIGAVGLGVLIAAASLRLARERTFAHARGLLRATIYYLPALLGCIALDVLRT